MIQTATALGSGNVIVQLQGDGNSIVAGLPHLVLSQQTGLFRRVHTDDAGKPSEIDVLRAPTRGIPLVGRDNEMSDMRAWLECDPPISARIMTGGAGYGKSRLALALIDEVTPQGWRAGFLTREEIKRFNGQQNITNWGWNEPVLAVVDYAAASARDLHAWLMELAGNAVWEAHVTDHIPPLRLLLLERHVEPRHGWWTEAFGIGNDAVVLERILDSPKPYVLGSIVCPDQRRKILTMTLERLGSNVTPPEPGSDQEFDRRLARLTWGGVPLFLMMAAATAAREGFGHVLTMESCDLAIDVAEAELARVRKVTAANGLPESLASLVDHVVAVATLCQGLAPRDAVDVIRKEGTALGYEVPGGPAVLREALTKALPGNGGGIAGVEPDFVAEALLLRVWTPDDTNALQAVSRAYSHKRTEVAESVTRTCHDYISRGYRHPIAWLSQIHQDSANDLDGLSALSDAIPVHTLELRETAVELCTSIVNHLRSRALGSQDLQLAARLALSLNNLSNRLSNVGRKEEALDVIDESIGLYRTLDAAMPGQFGVHLAMSVNNRVVHLSHLKQHEEALAASQEAVSICRSLVESHPDRFELDLAMSLNNLSNRLHDLGRFETGLVAAEESTEIYRRLAATSPDPFRGELAGSLNDLSRQLVNAGRHKEALDTIEEGTRLYRDLTAARPDAYRTHLAMSLNNLSNRLSTVGRFQDALDVMREAVQIRRELADDRPDVFRPYLAMYLSNLSVRLSNVGQPDSALNAIEEAVGIRRELAAAEPDVYRSDLAQSLRRLSDCLSRLRRQEDALDAIEEAVTTLKEPFLLTPPAYASKMTAITKKYRKLCRVVRRDPDLPSLATIDEVLRSMNTRN